MADSDYTALIKDRGLLKCVAFYEVFMAKMVGYMLTWTTYGSWLQGDKRGYVKDGEILGKKKSLEKANKRKLQSDAVRLTKAQCDIVKKAIYEKAKKVGQRIYAIAVCKTHVHLVADHVLEAIENSAAIYKSAASKALREKGFEGKVWTNGYDKRYCFDQESLRNKIGYVEKHKW